MDHGFYVTLRSRLSCRIVHCDKSKPDIKILALNEIVIDRGDSGSMVALDCFCDGIQFTNMHADGIIVCTATGSTAYSMSAGGPMVHPSTPSFVFTPICPHTLSCRPLVFPDTVTLKIQVPLNTRYTKARVMMDGKGGYVIGKGDHVTIEASMYPVPSVCQVDENADWFTAVKGSLHWNQRDVKQL